MGKKTDKKRNKIDVLAGKSISSSDIIPVIPKQPKIRKRKINKIPLKTLIDFKGLSSGEDDGSELDMILKSNTNLEKFSDLEKPNIETDDIVPVKDICARDISQLLFMMIQHIRERLLKLMTTALKLNI